MDVRTGLTTLLKFFRLPELVWATAFGLAFMLWRLPDPATPLPVPAVKQDISADTPPPFSFIDETFMRGINHSHVERSQQINGLHELFGPGVCPLDVDGNGWTDLFFVGGSGAHRFYGKKAWWANQSGNKLYLNNGRGYFSDISLSAGVKESSIGMGCATADLDNDGDDDILVTALGHNVIYENVGDNRFNKRQLGDEDAWSTTAALGDFNNDGLIDIYIANFIDYQHYNKRYEPSSGHTTVDMTAFQSQLFRPQRNFLYVNRGNMQFVEQATELGVSNADGRSVFATWLDINQDGFQDLLVGNREGSNSKVFINKKGEFFYDAEKENWYPFPKNYHAASPIDVTGDQSSELTFSTAAGFPGSVYQLKKSKTSPQAFSEMPTALNSSYAREQFGAIADDLNGDGKADLVTASGYMLYDQDSPSVALRQENLWRLNQGGQLRIFPASSMNRLGSSRSIVAVDVDNDGDKDIVITNNNDFAQLLINNSDAPQLHATSAAKGPFTTTFLSSYKSETTDFTKHAAAPPPALAFFHFKVWLLARPEALGPDVLRASYTKWSENEKHLVLNLLQRNGKQHLLLAFLQLALSDDPAIAKEANNVIANNDLGALLHDVTMLIDNWNDRDACEILAIYKNIFTREESFVREKPLLAIELTNKLDHYSANKQLCTIAVLAKSRSKRPVEKLINLTESQISAISVAAINALGELKYKDSLATLKSLSKHADHAVAVAAKQATALIHGDIDDVDFTQDKTAEIIFLSKSVRNSCDLHTIFEKQQLRGHQLSTLLRRCPHQALTQVADDYSDTLTTHHAAWLYNWHIDEPTYATFLKVILNSAPEITSQLVLGALNKNPPPQFSEVIVTALLANTPTTIPALLVVSLTNSQHLSMANRLSAIEVLSHIDPIRAQTQLDTIYQEITNGSDKN